MCTVPKDMGETFYRFYGENKLQIPSLERYMFARFSINTPYNKTRFFLQNFWWNHGRDVGNNFWQITLTSYNKELSPMFWANFWNFSFTLRLIPPNRVMFSKCYRKKERKISFRLVQIFQKYLIWSDFWKFKWFLIFGPRLRLILTLMTIR